MYRIINRDTNELIGLTDAPRYVALRNGTFVRVDENLADAVTFAGDIYNFGDIERITGAPFVHIIEIDGGEFVFDMQKSIADTNAAIDDIIITLLEG